MTARERVCSALEFRQTEIVPYHVTFSTEARAKMVDYYGDADFMDGIGNHLAMLSHRKMAKWTEVSPGFLEDEWGVVWNRTTDRDVGIVANHVLPEPTLGDYQLPDPLVPAIAEGYPSFVETNRDRFRVASLGFSLFERAWSLRGMDHLLVDMLDAPDFVNKLFDAITEFNLAQIDLALHHDIDCVYIGDDWGSQSGLIMGPSLWREFIKPRIARMYGRVRDAGKYVMIHSCGDVKSLFPELIEAGLNIFNPFQPETMDVYQTKKEYQGRLSFYGGISVQRLLPHGSPDEVRDETARLLRELGKGGGYIASPSHVVPADVPAENIAAMLEVLQGQ